MSLLPIAIGLVVLLTIIFLYITRPGPLDSPPSCLEEAIIRKAVAKIKWDLRPPFCGMVEQVNSDSMFAALVCAPGLELLTSKIIILGHANKEIRIQFDIDKVKITSKVYNNTKDTRTINLVHPDSIEHLSKAIEAEWSEMLRSC